ncbi:hypothetical protein DITRI_Ditri05aG0087600 [Diplodiscus trichospermus]
MEFVGKSVKKNFEGFGFVPGTVNSFDFSSGIFKIVYEDGNSEELNFHQVASLVMADDSNPTQEPRPDSGLQAVRDKPRVGRPRKRRRVERKVRVCPGNVEKETLESNTNGNLIRNVDLNERFVENLKENEGFDGNLNETLDEKGIGSRRDLNLNLNNNGDIEMKKGFDLNSSGFDLNLNDTYNGNNYFNVSGNRCGGGENVKKRGCIDLNLDANCDLEDNINVNCETQGRECGFDLNLGADEQISKDGINGNCGGQVQVRESTTCAEIVQETPKLEQNYVEGDVSNKELKEDHSSFGSVEGFRENGGGVVDKNVVNADDRQEVGLEGVPQPVIAVIDGCQDDMGSSYKQASGWRKRRKISNDLDSSTERVLRRSARRGSAKNLVSRTPLTTTCAVGDLLTSPSVSAVTEEKPISSRRKLSEEAIILPPKLQLPPSSQNLKLDGIDVLDIFSIYACLSSFSTLLFLSPFELEDFVAALKCQSPSSLFDCIHVSILQTLKKHLEYLSNEGSESASECLRSLNWGFMDSITWPIFMVEYLLIHGSGLNCGFDLSGLNLFRVDYYKQPAYVKVEILRCLCDDMIETEAIRSELNRRSLASETDMDFDRNINIKVCKKRKASMDVSGGSGLSEEIVDDSTDWNSDDCCLCKMDGSLICCDGCPAAYHSKCVGVVNALLPEGDWYCPECAIERHKPWVKPRKSPRGAEVLGIDPHGRLYYNSSGYLLVLDSCDAEYSLNYYHKDDLNFVLDVLKSSDILYGDLIKAICKRWDVAVVSNGASSNLDSLNSVCSETHMKRQIPTVSTSLPSVASAEICVIKNETVDDGKPEEKQVAVNSGQHIVEVTKSGNLLDLVAGTEIPSPSSEGSAERMQMASVIHNFQKKGSVEFSNKSEVPGKSSTPGNCPLTSFGLDTKQESKTKLASQQTPSVINMKSGDAPETKPWIGYMNCYSFAQTASLVLEELMHKPAEKTNEDSLKSAEEIIAMQMKVILKKSNRFNWPDIHNLYADARKENCGWCFSCRYPTDDTDCLFKITSGCVQEVSKGEMVRLQSKWMKKGHVIDVICHIFSIENRLHGLLSGPWLNQQYIKIWHKNILKESNIASAKHLLLKFEANLHHLALSSEWMKPVDSAVSMGSAFHIVTASSRGSAKHGIARKRGRCNDGECNPTSNPAVGPSICWWRGGRVSRQLFNWKVLPRTLVCKAARQAGGKKIPGILYPESSDFAKRSKSVAWRAAVELSTSVEQLAFQVRDLDSNLRWDDIENTHALPILDKDFKKSIRLFKKCVVRRKSVEGDGVNYLLDFGKRRIIPEIVIRYGTVVEESSSERKKYWLNESFVPLHLLKSFEEKRIARKSNKMISGKSSEINMVAKKSSKKRGFSHLFSKAERSEYHQCGHCNKDVLIRIFS